MKHTFFLLMALLLPLCAAAQKKSDPDKATRDSLLFEQLLVAHDNNRDASAADYSQCFPDEARLEKTSERNLYRVKGTAYHVQSLRSDFYVWKQKQAYSAVFGRKFPLESAVNLLLGYADPQQRQVEITHMRYGYSQMSTVARWSTVLALLSKGMNSYCSVTKISSEAAEATVVFHHPKRNYIHMLVVTLPMRELFRADGTFSAKMYTFIPQHNLKDIL